MTSPFSRMMDRTVDANFRKDPSGRLVFLPSGPRGKGYFVDSKSDEEKIRALVKMYRSATTVITFLTSPSIFVPALILDDYAGMTPREHRLAIAFWGPFVFLAGPRLAGMAALELIQSGDSELNFFAERGRS